MPTLLLLKLYNIVLIMLIFLVKLSRVHFLNWIVMSRDTLTG